MTRRPRALALRGASRGPLAEKCAKLLKKGSCVFVSGRLSYRSYTKDDEKREVAEIVIDKMLLLDKRAASEKVRSTSTTAETIDDDAAIAEDVPF